MGYILHHAIVVTGFASKSAEAYARAPEDLRTAFGEIQCNGYRSFLVCPDGGKEGDWWAGGTSDQGDAARARFKAHLRALEIEWVEVAFGHDDGRAFVTDSQWPQPEAPRDTRWTDAEWAAEQVALARRQADVARAEARELAAKYQAACVDLAELRAALEAARAAVHTPSPGVDDRRWSHPARDEGPDQRLVDGVVDAASAARRGAPRVVAEGRDPATRTRAETPPYDPGNCESCRNPIEGDYYRNREPGDIGGENYHRDCWAWVRSCGKGPRPRRYREEHTPSPCIALSAEQVHEALGWNVPAPTRALPVVPATCGECEHAAEDAIGWTRCRKSLHSPPVSRLKEPPAWCPIRAELAKAGGA